MHCNICVKAGHFYQTVIIKLVISNYRVILLLEKQQLESIKINYEALEKFATLYTLWFFFLLKWNGVSVGWLPSPNSYLLKCMRRWYVFLINFQIHNAKTARGTAVAIADNAKMLILMLVWPNTHLNTMLTQSDRQNCYFSICQNEGM